MADKYAFLGFHQPPYHLEAWYMRESDKKCGSLDLTRPAPKKSFNDRVRNIAYRDQVPGQIPPSSLRYAPGASDTPPRQPLWYQPAPQLGAPAQRGTPQQSVSAGGAAPSQSPQPSACPAAAVVLAASSGAAAASAGPQSGMSSGGDGEVGGGAAPPPSASSSATPPAAPPAVAAAIGSAAARPAGAPPAASPGPSADAQVRLQSTRRVHGACMWSNQHE